MVDMLLFSGKGFNAIGSAIAKATNTAAKFTPIKQAGKWVIDRIGNGVGRAYKFGVKTGTGIGGGIAAAGVRATGNIIDSAHRAMLSSDDYQRLFKPTIISKTPKNEAIEVYQEAIKSLDLKETNYTEPLVIALRKKKV